MKSLFNLIFAILLSLVPSRCIGAARLRNKLPVESRRRNENLVNTTTLHPEEADVAGTSSNNSRDIDVVWITVAADDDEKRNLVTENLNQHSIDIWDIKKRTNDEHVLIITAAVNREERIWLESLEGYSIVTNEVESQAILKLSRRTRRKSQGGGGINGYPCYRTVEETYATGQSIADNIPKLAKWIDIGDSWEKTQQESGGYDIYALVLTNTDIPGPKPKFLAIFAIHARELATAELGTRFAEMLINGYGVNPDITWLLDHQEVHLILQANPDGRKQAEDGTLWRKNTNADFCGGGERAGVDLNRNFDFQWSCCDGSSIRACNEDYRGPYPGSEPEVQAIQNYARSIFPENQRGGGSSSSLTNASPINATGIAMDVHSYGELIMWPWGHTGRDMPNYKELKTLGQKLAYFNDYTPVNSFDVYKTDGDSLDFLYGDLGVAAIGMELGTSFFESCSSFESNNGVLAKNLDSLFYAARIARAPYSIPSGPEALQVAATPQVLSDNPTQRTIKVTATIDSTRFKSREEPTKAIASAELFMDVPPWGIFGAAATASAVPMDPADGIFDQSIEDVELTIDVSDLSFGTHMIYVQGMDNVGNVGLVGAVSFEIANECTNDTECDDENFCNGSETCNVDLNMCVPGSDPCRQDGQACDETLDICIFDPTLILDHPSTPPPTHQPSESLLNNNTNTLNTGGELIQIRVDMFFDNFPNETAWLLVNKDRGEIIYLLPYNSITIENKQELSLSAASMGNSDNRNNAVSTFLDVLPGRYWFLILDSANDGICCRYGDGYARIYRVFEDENKEDVLIVDEPGTFSGRTEHFFYLG